MPTFDFSHVEYFIDSGMSLSRDLQIAAYIMVLSLVVGIWQKKTLLPNGRLRAAAIFLVTFTVASAAISSASGYVLQVTAIYAYKSLPSLMLANPDQLPISIWADRWREGNYAFSYKTQLWSFAFAMGAYLLSVAVLVVSFLKAR